VVEEPGVVLHEATVHALGRLGLGVPARNLGGARSQPGAGRDDTERLLPGERLFAVPIPAGITEDLVDETLGWVNRVKATSPKKPWFIYFSTGAIHGPHHTPRAYREKYQGKFDTW
jgi:arylsulfatase A-like enzyme